MTKIIPNQCDKNGNPYITLSDMLGSVVHYDKDKNFEYLQSVKGDHYTLDQLKNMKMDLNLGLIDPAYQWDEGNILARDQNTPKHAEVEVKQDFEIKSCIGPNQNVISVDTTRHGCNIQKLFNTNDAIKINLTNGVELNREFAQLSGAVNLMNQNDYKWIDLGLNEWELNNTRIKITKDCAEEKLKKEIEEHTICKVADRGDITVKTQSGEEAGGINLASWFFKESDLYYDLRGDNVGSRTVGKDNIYLKVLPCDEQKLYYKLALCDQYGNIATKTQEGKAVIDISKCNLIDGQKIQLKDYYREDEKPSFILKPSESKDQGESYENRSRAEVYEYDPNSHDIGDKVGKLNATDIRVSGKTFTIDNLLLDDRYTTFRIHDTATTITKKDGLYDMSKPFDYNGESVDTETTTLLLDDLLCLYDQNSLQEGIQIIG